MGLFNEIESNAAHHDAAPAGLDLHLPYHPTDMVWTLSYGKAVEKRVIKVTTEHRSLVGSRYSPSTRITVMLEDGTERDGSEVFTSKEDLINSL